LGSRNRQSTWVWSGPNPYLPVATSGWLRLASGHRVKLRERCDYPYPLSRFLYLIVNVKAGAAPPQPLAAFLIFVLSRDGQDSVAEQGFYALDAQLVNEGRTALGLLPATTPAAAATPAR
jgi:hypothetical protein